MRRSSAGQSIRGATYSVASTTECTAWKVAGSSPVAAPTSDSPVTPYHPPSSPSSRQLMSDMGRALTYEFLTGWGGKRTLGALDAGHTCHEKKAAQEQSSKRPVVVVTEESPVSIVACRCKHEASQPAAAEDALTHCGRTRVPIVGSVVHPATVGPRWSHSNVRNGSKAAAKRLAVAMGGKRTLGSTSAFARRNLFVTEGLSIPGDHCELSQCILVTDSETVALINEVPESAHTQRFD